jgi:hypothetical protein
MVGVLRGWKLGAVVVAAVAVAAAVVLFALGGYTPTTKAFAVNDTGATVTLDNCSDVPLTLAPGQKDEISPFEDASRSACTVFAGERDEGTPMGCLHVPAKNGQTILGVIVRVSVMNRGRGC